MRKMNGYEYQIDIRLDGKYYCRIYQHGNPGAIASANDYETEEEAIEAAKVLIQEHQAKTSNTY
jgi:hypothetical protein